MDSMFLWAVSKMQMHLGDDEVWEYLEIAIQAAKKLPEELQDEAFAMLHSMVRFS